VPPRGRRSSVGDNKPGLVQSREADFLLVVVAVSTRPIAGVRSGFDFPLDQKRFWLLNEGCREAAERRGCEALSEETQDSASVPGGLNAERAFRLLIQST
jgi:hypothetical protein